MRIAATVLSLTTALLFLVSATMNLRAVARGTLPHALSRLGISAALLRLSGTLELAACAGLLAGLLIPQLAIAAATGLALLTLAAITVHIRAADIRGALIGPAGPLLLSVATLTVGLAAL